MGLYIKGIEIPKEDEEIIIRIDSFGTVMTEYALPMDGCKAFLVPPHGRLIDADLYKKKLTEMISVEDMCGIDKALDNLDEMPAIIEAEEAKDD